MQRINVHFDERDIEALKRIADKQRVSVAHLIRQGALEIIRQNGEGKNADGPKQRKGR